MIDHPAKTWSLFGLLKAVEAKYREQRLASYWDAEREAVERRLSSLRETLGNRYGDPKIVGVGGSGIVVRLVDQQLANRAVASH